MRTLLIVLALCLVVAAPAVADLAPIQLDGFFDDWTALSPDFTDGSGDDGSSGIDFQNIWVANDQNYLFIRFETTADVQPDEQQQMMLYLDTDLDAGTGLAYGGLGAELVWEFGNRDGTFYYKGGNAVVEHADVGLLMGPTVSSTQFEIALARDAVPAAGASLFLGDTVRFILRDGAGGGDLCPDSGSISYTFSPGTLPVTTIPLERNDPAHIRLTTWNIQSDGLFDGGAAEAAQDRMLKAMDPDMLIVCEVWYHTAAEVRDMIETHLPSDTGETWYAVGIDGGNVICSRFPILQSWEINPGYRDTGVLLDLPNQDTDLLLIACHWRCCTADADRQEEADSIIGFLRDAKTPGGLLDLPEGTPFLLAGDLNLVGWQQQLQTILTGDIINEGTYGSDMAPDWNGAPFVPVQSRHPDARVSYTWRNDYSSYYPGMLDWILYTDSALDLQNHYILETRTMTATTLATYGLQQYDTTDASDHAPRVADFTVFNPLSPVPGVPRDLGGARLLPNAPNPFNPRTELRFALEREGTVVLEIYDARGRKVAGFSPAAYTVGTHAVTWDGTDDTGRPVASGIYRVRMTARLGNRTVSREQAVTLVK